MSKRKAAPPRKNTINWFNFNYDAPSFYMFGEAQVTLQHADAAVKGPFATIPAKQFEALRAVRLAIPRLVELAKCTPNDAKALLGISRELETTERALQAATQKRKRGRPLYENKMRVQARFILAAYWQSRLLKGAISLKQAKRKLSKLIPPSALEKKQNIPLSREAQLDAWFDLFNRKKGRRRRDVFEEICSNLISVCSAYNLDPLTCTPKQITSWLLSEPSEPL